MSVRSSKSGITQRKSINKALKNGRRGIDELGLLYDRNDKRQITRLASILGQYLKYPSVEEAEKHRRANKLGALDQKTPEQIQQQLKLQDQVSSDQDSQDGKDPNNNRQSMQQNTKQQKQNAKKKKKAPHCDCCGMAVQSQQLSLLTHTHHVNHIGMSTYLYFMTMKNLVTMLLIMIFAFGLFAGASNLVSSKMYKQHITNENIGISPSNMTYQSFLQLSLGSKHYLSTDFTRLTFEIQCWLGLVTILLWGLAFIYVKLQEKIFEDKVDFNTASAGDFTLQFSNIPPNLLDYCTKQDIERILTSYYQRVKRDQEQHFDKTFAEMNAPIKVYSVNLVSSLDLEKQFDEEDNLQNPKLKEYEAIIKEIEQSWKQCIKQKSKSKTQLNYDHIRRLNKQYNQIKKKKKAQKMRLLRQLYGQQKQQKRDINYSLFVTFEDTRNKELIQRLHERQASILHNLPCTKKRVYLTVKGTDDKKYQIDVEPAPQPEDIIWANYNISSSKRWRMRLLTFFVTVVTLTISFFAVYFLTEVQISITDENMQKSTASTLISFAISGVLFAVNFLVAEMINRLTKLQRNTTYTREQTSIGFKSIMAQLINSIVIPIAINKIVKKNLYGVDGLADDVFYQALTFAILTPLLKVINPNYIKYLIVRWWNNRPWKRIQLSQKRLNKINQELDFEIGSEYVEVISMFMFAAFYASLQPAVVPIIAAGLFALYYAQKFSLYRISKRPTPGNNEINTVLYNFIFLGPLLFAIGSYCWTDLLVEQKLGRIPNFISLVLAIAIFLAPYQQIIRPFIKQAKTIRLAKYSIDRFIIPSQYASFNPLTRQKAKLQFRKAKQQFLFNIKHKTKQQKKQLQRRIQTQNMYGTGQQQQYQSSQQDDEDQDHEPYYQIYINNSSMELLEKQTDQLEKWLKLKEEDENIRDIPYYVYNGDYQNQDLNIVQVNFEELQEQEQEGDQGHDFQGYNPDKAQFQSDEEQQQQEEQEEQIQSKRSDRGRKNSQIPKSKAEIQRKSLQPSSLK